MTGTTTAPRTGAAVVRDARPGDAPAVSRVAHRALPRTYGASVPEGVVEAVLEQTYSIHALEECIEARRLAGHFLVAERDGVVAGYLDFEYRDGDDELHRIYVDPWLTGLGIGRQLLDDLHSRLPPATAYILMVLEGNAGARRFYAREGFEQEARADARDFYAEHMAVSFPSGVPALPCLVLRSPRVVRRGRAA